jgi:hypothetical protein
MLSIKKIVPEIIEPNNYYHQKYEYGKELPP